MLECCKFRMLSLFFCIVLVRRLLVLLLCPDTICNRFPLFCIVIALRAKMLNGLICLSVCSLSTGLVYHFS